MDTFRQHEIFEIQVLDLLKRSGALSSLVFGGGTMLRLCHELNRYSTDLDFWFLKKTPEDKFLGHLNEALSGSYEIMDSHIKHYSLVIEVRSPEFARRLKIEIRRDQFDWECREKIAFSRFSSIQVLLKCHTLEQTMKNKVAAFLDRQEIRDCFDIEFLLRRGVELPLRDEAILMEFQNKMNRLKELDFKVKLGSVLESDMRNYYISDRFSFLREKLALGLSSYQMNKKSGGWT